MKRLWRLARSPWLLGPAFALACYAAAGYGLIPVLIHHYAPRLAAGQIKRPLSLGGVRFDPFRFILELDNVVLNDANGEPLAAFGRLFVDLEVFETLANRAVTFGTVSLERPAVHAVLDPAGRLNLAKIADDLAPSDHPPAPSEELLPLAIGHATLVDGTLEFTDRSRSTPITDKIEAIDLEVDAISTLPDREGSHHIHAKLRDGAILDWQGGIGLNPIQSEGEVRIEAFKLASAWEFIRDRVNLEAPSGQLDLALHYRFRKIPEATDLALDALAAKVAGLRLIPAGAKEPILALETIELRDGAFDLAKRAVKVPVFLVRKGRLRADVNEQGELNWQKLVRSAPPVSVPTSGSAGPQPPGVEGPPWQIELGGIGIGDIGIDYTDSGRRFPIDLEVDGSGIGFRAMLVAGREEPHIIVDNLYAELNRLRLAEPSRPANLITLDAFHLKDGHLDLSKREITLQQLSLNGGGTVLERGPDGVIRLLDVLTPGDRVEKIRKDIDAIKTEAEREGRPWKLALKRADLQGFRAAVGDRTVSPPLLYDLKDIELSLSDFVNDGQTPLTFAGKLNVEQGGSLDATGSASQSGDKAEADVRIDGFDLKGLQGFVAEAGALRLERGDLSARLHVTYQQGTGGRSITAKGDVGSTGLLLNDARTDQRFLAWKNLTVEGIDVAVPSNRLAIKEIHITEPEARVEIFEDHTTNVAAIFRGKPAATPRRTPPPVRPAPPRSAHAPAGGTFPVSVQRVRIDDATVDFSDESLVLPFRTRIRNFDGHISGISTEPPGRTLLKFEGQVDDYGEASLEGQLDLMQYKVFSDLTLLFRNLDMSSLSPYSGTFAGRRIRSGKLNVDLLYRIERSKLKSNGKMVLEQLTLGEHVDSPRAKSLPLDLAVALLTDSEGKISVSVPIEGDVDSPSFAYGRIIWDAIANVITKAVAAPFTALAGVFGEGGEDVGEIFFAPGKDGVPPPEREKLHKIADALARRPRVTVAIAGRYDPALDADALKSRQLRIRISEMLGINLLPGEDPGPIAVNSAKTQKVLEQLAAEDAGNALSEAQAAFRQAAGREPKRIGTFSAWLDKAGEDADFYQLLFDRLVAHTPLPPKALETLAERRSQAILKELTARGGLQRNRVRLGATASVTGSEGRVPAKLELSAAGD